MNNCVIKKNPATVHADLPYFGQAIKVHANDLTGDFADIELEVSGKGDLLVYTTNGKRLTINGVLKDNPFVYHNGGGFGVLPDGTYDIIIIDKSYCINTVNVRRLKLSVDNVYPLTFRRLTNFGLPELCSVPQGLFDMLNGQNDIEYVDLVHSRSPVKFSLDTFKNKVKLKRLNLNNKCMQGRSEDLYEAQCENRRTSGSCVFIFDVGVTFNNVTPKTKHVVTFDGAGGCVVKDGLGNNLGSYDGSTWTYS